MAISIRMNWSIALADADNIIATLREPFVVVDKSLRVRTQTAPSTETPAFRKRKTKARFVDDLGNGQWDIPERRTLLSLSLSDGIPLKTSRSITLSQVLDKGTCRSTPQISPWRATARCWYSCY